MRVCVCDVQCVCVMYILVLSILHVQLLSLDMVVWDADYDVILLSVGFSTS